MSKAKEFEDIIKKCLAVVPNNSITRLYDPTGGYGGVHNIADFQGYKYPYQYYLECKTTAGNTLPLTNITTGQLEGMLEQSRTPGIVAGVIIWFYEKDITCFVPINEISRLLASGYKSVNVKDLCGIQHFLLVGTKKRVYWEYDGEQLLDDLFCVAFKRWGK